MTTISRHGTRPILNQFSSPFRGPSRWRGSTLLGKIQIVKAFIIPKFLSKPASISVSNDLIKEINELIDGFIRKGNGKIKRSALINGIENGGLRCLT